MPAPQMAPLPPGLELGGKWLVRFTALNPTTGAVNASVKVSEATMQVTNLSAGPLSRLETADWQLVPEKGP